MTPVISEVAARPLVLVTNDDGIGSPGMRALACAIERAGGRVLSSPLPRRT